MEKDYNVTLAFISYILYVFVPYQFIVMMIRRSKITELRKQKLKVEILNDLKEFCNIF